MAFVNENVDAKLPKDDKFQVGRSNVDNSQPGSFEKGFLLPFLGDPVTSWEHYECTVGVMLDSGIVVHNRLPQVDNAPDTLASVFLDDPNMEKNVTGGVNLRCGDQFQDIVQRMGHARYWFHMWGQALRVAYQIPIPGLRSVGGVAVVPYDKNPQFAYNRVVPGANFGGVVLWYAQWSLWYTTASQPVNNAVPVSDPVAEVRGVPPKLPKGIQVPFSGPDDNAQKSGPPPQRLGEAVR